MGAEETAVMLNRAAERAKLADLHEAEALKHVHSFNPARLALAANHFTVAAGLRGQARFRP